MDISRWPSTPSNVTIILCAGKLKSPKELKTFQVRSQGGKVQVLLDVNAKKRFDSNYWRGILDAQASAAEPEAAGRVTGDTRHQAPLPPAGRGARSLSAAKRVFELAV